MKKQCFKCRAVLPLSGFYKHPQMGDGLLGKCKACTKKDVAANYYARHEQYREYDRMRQQEVYRKENKVRYRQTFYSRHPQKRKAHYAVHYAVRMGHLIPQPCEKCGKKAEAHHDDYSRPLDVRWLCLKHHREHHRSLR